MTSIGTIARVGIIAMALAAGPLLATAQEISPTQLAAALDVVRSSGSSRSFDVILPNLAQQAEDRLVGMRPDIHTQIVAAVDSAAVKLIPRRVDLDNDIARVWAKNFTEDELKTIAAFYKTTAGKKFAALGPQIYAQEVDSANRWQDRLADELFQKSQDELKAAGIDF